MKVRFGSKPVVGKDGVTYHVITLIGTGRGWHSRCLYAVQGPTVLTGTVFGNRDLGKGPEVVVKLDDASMLVRTFTERPYVSKRTGIRNPHVASEFNEPRPLRDVYGAVDGRAWVREGDVERVD